MARRLLAFLPTEQRERARRRRQKKMQSVAFVSMLLLFICYHSAVADPSQTVQRLMTEPLSMWDWGLFRLEMDLREWKFPDINPLHDPVVLTEYDWDGNRIKVSFTVYPKYENLIKTPAKDVCRIVTRRVRYLFGTNLPKDLRREISISRFFNHKNFGPRNRPENWEEDIENITIVGVGVRSNKNGKPPFQEELARCESPLLGDEIFFKDK